MKFPKCLLPLLLLLLLAVLAGSVWLAYRSMFPHGWSHSCDKQLMQALLDYAEDHGGAYPSGEATPEASLSLLYPKYANEWVLQGKSVPLDAVKALLEKGERLGPDTCGWHYVEGLTTSDDHGIAIFWDKVGLGHNGQRLAEGGGMVFFVGGSSEYIPGEKWDVFLEEQEKLLQARKVSKEPN